MSETKLSFADKGEPEINCFSCSTIPRYVRKCGIESEFILFFPRNWVLNSPCELKLEFGSTSCLVSRPELNTEPKLLVTLKCVPAATECLQARAGSISNFLHIIDFRGKREKKDQDANTF